MLSNETLTNSFLSISAIKKNQLIAAIDDDVTGFSRYLLACRRPANVV
jgi:hypothetical protein